MFEAAGKLLLPVGELYWALSIEHKFASIRAAFEPLKGAFPHEDKDIFCKTEG